MCKLIAKIVCGGFLIMGFIGFFCIGGTIDVATAENIAVSTKELVKMGIVSVLFVLFAALINYVLERREED